MLDEDKRHFKRYESGSECEVRTDSGTYQGRVIDYSDGLGAVFADAPELTVGAKADIKVFDPEMQFKGEVVWISRSGDELRAGFKRLDSLQGSLKSFALADVLIGLQRSTKTGVLRVASGSIVKEIFIRNGDMIFASSNDIGDRFGELLLKRKKISQEEYDKAHSISEQSGSKLGKVLVELGCLKPKEVFRAVQDQVENIILSLFSLEKGKFRFQEGAFSSEDLITLRISAANIIYRGIKRVKDILHIKKAVPPRKAVLDLSPSPMNIFQDIELDEADKAVLSCIDGKRSLKTVLSLSPSSESETLKTICALISMGMVRARKEEGVPVELKIEEVEDFIKKPAEEVTPEFVDKVEATLGKLGSIGYYDILGIGKDATAEQISKAYYSASKEFHPDRHFAMPPNEQYDLKGKLTEIFTRITEAYEHLSDPGKKAEYDRKLAGTAEVEKAARDKEAREKAAKEKAEKEKAAREKAARDKEAREKAAKEKAEKEKAEKETAAKETAAKETAAKENDLGEAIGEAEDRSVKSGKYVPVAIAAAVILLAVIGFALIGSDDKTEKTARVAEPVPEQVAREQASVPAEEVQQAEPEESAEKDTAKQETAAPEPVEDDEAVTDAGQEEASEVEEAPEIEVAETVVPAPEEEEAAPEAEPGGPEQEEEPVQSALLDKGTAPPVPASENIMRYKEQFDNNRNNWEVYDMTMASARIADGKYYIMNKTGTRELIVLHPSPLPAWERFTMEISIKAMKAARSYGFVFGAEDSNNCFVFQILGEESYSIRRYNRGVPEELKTGKVEGSGFRKNSFNILLVEKNGRTLRFYVNDSYIDEVSGISLPGTRAGFLVDGKAEIAVDHTRTQVWLDQ